jgi:uncharacterized NAD(P)/FAD-binding protein YdhS
VSRRRERRRPERDPLVRSLLEAGLARPDPIGLGLDADGDGALLGADLAARGNLLLAGALGRGRRFEHTAVAELRGEAPRIAARAALV